MKLVIFTEQIVQMLTQMKFVEKFTDVCMKNSMVTNLNIQSQIICFHKHFFPYFRSIRIDLIVKFTLEAEIFAYSRIQGSSIINSFTKNNSHLIYPWIIRHPAANFKLPQAPKNHIIWIAIRD